MALFFDARWFDAHLADQGHDRDQLAAHMGLTRTNIDMIFKDQRELTGDEVTLLAAFLQQPVEEVVDRAGIATPQPGTTTPAPDRIERLEHRIHTLEQQVADLTQQLLGLPQKDKTS